MLTGRTLLLADDSPTVQKVVSLVFGDEGMTVVAVGSGAEAIRELAQAVPDIVLADVHMPEPNGYEVCAHVKRAERLRHIPVLLLVGTFEPFNEAEARRVGADDVLTKPFQSIRDLVSKVGNLLGGHADEPPAAETHESERARHVEPQARAAAASGEHADAPPAFPWARAQASAPTQTGGTFQDFDMDDQTIQSTSAEAFSGRAADSPEAAAPFVVLDEEPHAAVEAEPRPAPALSESAPALSYTAAASPAPEFVARTAQAAPTDDALLDLGEEAQSAPAADEDEFILDLEDEALSAPPVAAAEEPRVMYAEGLASSPAEAAAPLMTEEATHTDMRALEADAQAYAQPPQSGQALEHVLPADEAETAWQAAPPVETYDAEEMGVAAEAAMIEEPVREAPPPAELFTHEPQSYEPAAQAPAWTERAPHEAPAPESFAPPAEEEQHAPAPAGFAPVAETQANAVQLSPETIDAIARRVVELMSEQVVREVAWEVVPDLAERLIKRRLAEEQA